MEKTYQFLIGALKHIFTGGHNDKLKYQFLIGTLKLGSDFQVTKALLLSINSL